MSITIEPPKNAIHDGQMFARMDTPAKLANCIDWATYILKVRSKDAVPGRETYFNSCHAANARKREAERQKYKNALEKFSRPALAGVAAQEVLDAAAATNPSHWSVPDWKGIHTLAEKETQHERHTTPHGDTAGPGQADSISQASSSGCGPSGSSQSGMGQAGPRPRVPAPSASGPQANTIRLERQDGGAGKGDGTQVPNILIGLIGPARQDTPESVREILPSPILTLHRRKEPL